MRPTCLSCHGFCDRFPRPVTVVIRCWKVAQATSSPASPLPHRAAPPQSTPELLQGFDTATQVIALFHWLRRQPSPRIARVFIANDPDHTARAVVSPVLPSAARAFSLALPI